MLKLLRDLIEKSKKVAKEKAVLDENPAATDVLKKEVPVDEVQEQNPAIVKPEIEPPGTQTSAGAASIKIAT